MPREEAQSQNFSVYWSCRHEKCHMKFSSIEERNCHEEVHQAKRLELEREEMEDKRSKQRLEDKQSQANRMFTCRKLKCKGKDLKFYSREDLRRHSKEVHCHWKSLCPRCSKVCINEEFLFEHTNTIHFKIRCPFVCSECDRRESRKRLTNHLRTLHSKTIKRSEYFFENESASFVYETDDC